MFPHGRFSQSVRKAYTNYYVPSPVRLEFKGKEFGVESTSWPTSLTYSAIYSELTLTNYVSIQISNSKFGSWLSRLAY